MNLPALKPVLIELLQAVDASACYLYLASENQVFIPFLTEGNTETGQTLFFAKHLSPQTDSLLAQLVANPITLAFNLEAGNQRMAGSILEKLKARAALIAPILGDKGLLGLLVIARQDRCDDFSGAEIRQIEWLATCMAPLIEKDQQQHQSQERLAEAEALHQITLTILQKPGLDEAVKIICNEAQQMTASCGASLAMIENTNWLRVVYSAGEAPDKLGRLRANRSHLGRAIRQRTEPLIIHPLPEHDDSLSRLAIPLQVKGSTIGLLTLFKKADFSADDVRLMRIFAGQAAIALDHAQLTGFVQEMTILEERHRLSRELHDSVNQLLYGITLYTEAALRQMDQGKLDATRRYLKNIEESGQAALKEMRMLIFGLRPSGLTQMGLQASLTQRLKSVEEKLGLQPTLKWRVISPLAPHVEEALYGIAQEALNNVIRHAGARAISIRLAENEQVLTMTIKDDGAGFDPETVSTGGIGLKTMRERAASLNARLRIESQPGQGTRVIVEVTI